ISPWIRRCQRQPWNDTGTPTEGAPMTATLEAVQDWDLASAPTTNAALVAWVRETARLTQPDRVVWCDGSQDEWERLTEEMVEQGTLIRLDPAKRPNSFLARSAP